MNYVKMKIDVNNLSNSAEFVITIKKKKYLIFILTFEFNDKNYSMQGNSHKRRLSINFNWSLLNGYSSNIC